MENDLSNKNQIAIIGGGISGIVATKYAKESGLTPTLFEKQEEIGGIWSKKTGYHWNSMKTNSSRYEAQFSDWEWPKDAPVFGYGSDLLDYMLSYIQNFDLAKYFRCNAEVKKIEYLNQGEKVWRVEWLDRKSNISHSQCFTYLIIATGYLSCPDLSPFVEYINDKSNDQIKFMHSSNYKENSSFRDKNVIIVGGAFSATQISSEIGEVSKSVVTLVRNPRYCVKRTVYNPHYQKSLPIDFTTFSFKYAFVNPDITQKEQNLINNKWLSEVTQQNAVSPVLVMKENSDETPSFCITDDFLESVRKMQVTPIRAEIKNIKANVVYLTDGSSHKPDAVIFCNGYKYLPPPFEEHVLQALNYDKEEKHNPFNLLNSTFNPKFKTLAFVGVSRGFFLCIELQAKYALFNLMGKSKFSLEAINAKLEENLKLRSQISKNFAIVDTLKNLTIKIAEELNLLPDINKINKEDPEFHDFLMNVVSTPAIYFLGSVDPKMREVSKRVLLQIKKELNL